MTYKYRPHLDTHEMTSQAIGAGLVRVTCTACHHVAISDVVEQSSLTEAEVPAWMRQAAERFSGTDVVATSGV